MLALLGSVAGATAIPARVFAAFSQSDYLAQIPTETPLPPIEERLPKTPRVLNLAERGLKPGRYGGSMRMLIGGQRDIRFMPINCYSRLVGYNSDLKLEADILEAYEVENDRIFTFRLREGHKWSDGSPFTADDFRYVWDDVFHEKKLAKGGPPAGLMINGKPPRFEVIDARTVRYSWDDPNPDFLADQASPSPTRLMFPAAYMKQFHMRYQTKELLAQHIARERVDDWAALHQKMSRVVRPENPNLPTLDAWRNRTAPPAERFVFERNPYYYRVDENGLQLPYIDKVMLDV
ncbi:MAG: ABC transporter substrate-binding protein, partial [Rhizobiaceae bacterium]